MIDDDDTKLPSPARNDYLNSFSPGRLSFDSPFRILANTVITFFNDGNVQSLVDGLTSLKERIIKEHQSKFEGPSDELKEFCNEAGLTLRSLEGINEYDISRINRNTHDLLDRLGKLNPCQGKFTLGMVKGNEMMFHLHKIFDSCVRFLVFHDKTKIEIIGQSWVIQFLTSTFVEFSGEDLSFSEIPDLELEIISMPGVPPRFKKFFEYFDAYWVLDEGFYF